VTFGIPLFRKRAKQKVMPLPLQPRAGEIYGHVFENPRVGLARDLFWNASIDFEPVQLDGEEWDCSLGVEWLTWTLQNWQDLDGRSADELQHPDLLECSLYLFAEHHWATLQHFTLTKLGPASFEADFRAVADVDDGSGPRQFEVSGKCELNFTGIIIVPANFGARAPGQTDAEALVSEFMSLDHLRGPRVDNGRFMFEPYA
jgi:hypothetical protein